MIFDIHAHVGETKNEVITAETILKIMDKSGIDKTILLPTASTGRYMAPEKLSEEVNKAPQSIGGFCCRQSKGSQCNRPLGESSRSIRSKGLKNTPRFYGRGGG